MIVVVWHSMSSIRWFPQKWSPITQNTHMMTRNIVNILPLSLRSSHLTQDVERWNEEHPKKRTSTPTLTNFSEEQMYCESFKLKEDVQMDFQFTEVQSRRWFAPFPPNRTQCMKKVENVSCIQSFTCIFYNMASEASYEIVIWQRHCVHVCK